MPSIAKWLLVLSALALPLVLWAGGVFNDAPEAAMTVSDHDVIYFSKEIAKTFLPEPQKAVFPEDDQFVVRHLGGLRWQVSGYADIDNGFKKMTRIPLSLEVEKHPGRWKLIKRETLELVRAYYKIREARVRKRIFEMVKAVGAASHAEVLGGRKQGKSYKTSD